MTDDPNKKTVAQLADQIVATWPDSWFRPRPIEAMKHVADLRTTCGQGMDLQGSEAEAVDQLINILGKEVFDVAVDLRKSSETFGKWVGEIISADNKKQMWIPEGFAHGFVTLSDTAEFLYKTTSYYSAHHERAIKWNDKDINIKWPSSELILSERDEAAQSFKEAIYFD